MFKYTLLLLIALVTSCYCVNFKPCNPIKNIEDRCECYIRSETLYYSDEKECANVDTAKKIARNLCKKLVIVLMPMLKMMIHVQKLYGTIKLLVVELLV